MKNDIAITHEVCLHQSPFRRLICLSEGWDRFSLSDSVCSGSRCLLDSILHSRRRRRSPNPRYCYEWRRSRLWPHPRRDRPSRATVKRERFDWQTIGSVKIKNKTAARQHIRNDTNPQIFVCTHTRPPHVSRSKIDNIFIQTYDKYICVIIISYIKQTLALEAHRFDRSWYLPSRH